MLDSNKDNLKLEAMRRIIGVRIKFLIVIKKKSSKYPVLFFFFSDDC